MSTKDFSEFYDRIAHTMLKAPDRYRPETGMTLDKAFIKLNKSLDASKNIVGSYYDEFKENLDLSLAAYKKNDIKEGIRRLQVIDDLIRDEIR